MDKITVVCHKDHVVGYEDYVGKCLLCEVERLQHREWVGLTDEERSYYLQSAANVGWWQAALYVEAKLKEKNNA